MLGERGRSRISSSTTGAGGDRFVTIRPTLHCPCDGRFLERALTYSEPPDGETRFDLAGADYVRHFDRCRTCGHFFGRHDLPLEGLYEDAYVDATYGDVSGMQQRLERVLALPPDRSDNHGRVARVLTFAEDEARRPRPPGAGARRVLDVGAGIGVFPAAMKRAGWDVTAIEPDRRTVELLRASIGIDAHDRDLRELDPAALPAFDAVTFNKVLEHVEDPVALLAHASRFLAEWGFCYVEVPDVAAASEGAGREEFFVEHHHVFSPASLAMLGERAGLRVALIDRLVEPSGKFTVFAFLVPA